MRLVSSPSDPVDAVLRRARQRRHLPPPPVRQMLRQQLGLSQREVAELLDVTRVSVSRWETGERTPRGELLLRYLELLGRLARELE